jgi:ribonuclease HIII
MNDKNDVIEYYNEIKPMLLNANIIVSDYNLIDYGLQFKVLINGFSATIRVFQNKKGIIKIDYSQIKDDKLAKKIRKVLEEEITIDKHDLKDQQQIEDIYPIIGIDESGKGDYFGPLISAAVFLDKESAKKLKDFGIKDSKKLSDKVNIDLAYKIFEICKGYYSIIEISPDKYNTLIDQMKKEGKNVNILLAWTHAKALEEVLSKVDCNTALSDQFGDESLILRKLQERGKKIKLIQMHKAEQNIAVAAASILARARFLERLSNLSKELKIDLPKGASSKVIDVAKKFIGMYGKESLRKIAKLHFKTTENVYKI